VRSRCATAGAAWSPRSYVSGIRRDSELAVVVLTSSSH
jgi:hypothetical protein